jgi:malic enzyme
MATGDQGAVGERSSPTGRELLGRPELNRDAAFTAAEREQLRLRGLLPWRVVPIQEQVELELEHLRRKGDDLERYIGLAALQERNQTLFYRVLIDHLEELAPIVYTPTVGQACREFSHVVRRPHGLWVTPDDLGHIPDLLRNAAEGDVKLLVVTDNERILGLGDQGAGGMGIPVGKLALYTAGAGIHPSHTLPVSLDCGTDNQELLADPQYLGYPRPRLRGPEYDAFIEAFVEAVLEVFPRALLQWEDFKQHNAIRLLDRYRRRIASFNDDVQGTAAVVLGGILAELRHRGERLSDQRLVFLGAGAAGTGIARMAEAFMAREGTEPPELRRRVMVLDSRGLVFEGREALKDDTLPFMVPAAVLAELGMPAGPRHDLDEVVARVSPTILVGVSGVAGSFTERAVRAMAQRCPAPIIMPLSNPTLNSEATPEEIMRWTDGRAVVATGSPFAPVRVGGRDRVVGQANNVFVFPGIGLGTIIARAREVTDGMLLTAAEALSQLVTQERLEAGAMYPNLQELRSISREIALAVARKARSEGVGQLCTDEALESAADREMWEPGYLPLA